MSDVDVIELLVLDVDGVLTPGMIALDHHGREIKMFHVRDGLAIKLWMHLGGQVAIITSRRSTAVLHRARELGVEHVHLGAADKLAVLASLLKELELAPEQVAAIGDDLPDLPLLRHAGYAMAVGDAAPELQQIADYVTSCPGGHAAVREAIEHLLKAQQRWHEAVDLF